MVTVRKAGSLFGHYPAGTRLLYWLLLPQIPVCVWAAPGMPHLSDLHSLIPDAGPQADIVTGEAETGVSNPPHASAEDHRAMANHRQSQPTTTSKHCVIYRAGLSGEARTCIRKAPMR